MIDKLTAIAGIVDIHQHVAIGRHRVDVTQRLMAYSPEDPSGQKSRADTKRFIGTSAGLHRT